MNADLVQRLNSIHRSMSQGSFAEGEALARDALQRYPSAVEIIILLSQALDEQGKTGEGEGVLREALKAHPDSAEINLVLGLMLQIGGRFAEATEFLDRCLEIDPNQAKALFALTRSKRFTEDDLDLVSKIEDLVQHATLPPFDRASLFYALGKAREDLGQFEAAMKAYDEANIISLAFMRGGAAFNQKAYGDSFDFVKSYFTKEFMRSHSDIGNDSVLPIFVIGMPRSGTTLLDQMISCHSEVGAAGEMYYWLANARTVLDPSTQQPNPDRAAKLAQDYVDELESAAPGKARVTDKMPINFTLLGFIHLMLPKASIIHVHRNPVANCFSIYTTSYRRPPEYAHDRKSIAFAYRQYEGLMRHWNDALPEGRIYDVEYETLIDRPEATMRGILEHCGLEYQQDCADPRRNKQPIRTPSLWQARQPLYKSAMERWRNFEPWLPEFSSLR